MTDGSNPVEHPAVTQPENPPSVPGPVVGVRKGMFGSRGSGDGSAVGVAAGCCCDRATPPPSETRRPTARARGAVFMRRIIRHTEAPGYRGE